MATVVADIFLANCSRHRPELTRSVLCAPIHKRGLLQRFQFAGYSMLSVCCPSALGDVHPEVHDY